ncbi:transposase DNA-binding-containing protein [Phycisphaerales bacterium AB-hyl4]|uniref:Transposase DNA-binding-containing protein n=1 Tax=Natronomicrosphaera hydrolytica TaxID=3242702 RepID=A0ABV4U6V4_9BACT
MPGLKRSSTAAVFPIDGWAEGSANSLKIFPRESTSPCRLACQDWAATKAAYRFLDNPRVDESAILAGHFQATRARSTMPQACPWCCTIRPICRISGHTSSRLVRLTKPVPAKTGRSVPACTRSADCCCTQASW